MENPLTLKVMRLSKPTFTQLSPIDLLQPFSNDSDSIPNPSLTLPSLMTLPQSFGNIYLGETFSSFLCFTNEHQIPIQQLHYKIHLQTQSQTLLLQDNAQSEDGLLSLLPKQSLEFVIHHEMKELGWNLLICSVNYYIQQKDGLELKKLKKFYKFQSLNPMGVKTKINCLMNDYLLECQLQNLSTMPILLERLLLETPPSFISKEITHMTITNNSNESRILQSQEVFQYLFHIQQMNQKEIPQLPLSLGKLDIVWRSFMGEQGRLMTSPLTTKRYLSLSSDPSVCLLPSVEIHSPDYILLEQVFALEFRFMNHLPQSTQPFQLKCEKSKMSSLLWCGLAQYDIPQIATQQSFILQVKLFPLMSGMQRLEGLQWQCGSESGELESVDVYIHTTDSAS